MKEPKNVTMLDVIDSYTTPTDGIYSILLQLRKVAMKIDDYTVKISRKQYYSRLSKLVKTDLVKRKGAKYVLTPSENVIYAVQLEFAEAVHQHMESMEEMP